MRHSRCAANGGVDEVPNGVVGCVLIRRYGESGDPEAFPPPADPDVLDRAGRRSVLPQPAPHPFRVDVHPAVEGRDAGHGQEHQSTANPHPKPARTTSARSRKTDMNVPPALSKWMPGAFPAPRAHQ